MKFIINWTTWGQVGQNWGSQKQKEKRGPYLYHLLYAKNHKKYKKKNNYYDITTSNDIFWLKGRPKLIVGWSSMQ